MDKKRVRELRAKAQDVASTMHIGKEGISGRVVEEVRSQLKNKKLVKVRLLPSHQGDREACAHELARACEAILVEIRGRTVVLAEDLPRSP